MSPAGGFTGEDSASRSSEAVGSARPLGPKERGPHPHAAARLGATSAPRGCCGAWGLPGPRTGSQRAACCDAARCTVSLGRCADSVCRRGSVQGHPCRPRPCSSCGRKPGRVLPAGGAAGHAELHAAPASEGPAGIGTCLTASPFLHESHVVCVCSDVCAISVLLPDACIRRSPGPCLRSGRGLLPVRSLPRLLPAQRLSLLLPARSLPCLLPARSLPCLLPVWSLPLLLPAVPPPPFPSPPPAGRPQLLPSLSSALCAAGFEVSVPPQGWGSELPGEAGAAAHGRELTTGLTTGLSGRDRGASAAGRGCWGRIRRLRPTRGSGWKVAGAGRPPLALEVRERVPGTRGEAPAPQAPSASLPDGASAPRFLRPGGPFPAASPACRLPGGKGRGGREGRASTVELASRPECTHDMGHCAGLERERCVRPV